MQKWPCVKAEAPKTVLLPTYLMALIPFHGATDGSHRRECGVCEMARCRRGRQTIRRQKSSPHRVFTGGHVKGHSHAYQIARTREVPRSAAPTQPARNGL